MIGREHVAAEVGRFVDELGRGTAGLVVLGEVGIGKSAALRWSADMLRARHFSLLSARPLESEFPLEFAVLADLLEPVPRHFIDELPPPQRLAIDAAVLRTRESTDPVDPRTVASAVLTVVRALARERPVVLLIDDLMWADSASARIVSYVLRRTGSAPIGLVAAARTGWAGGLPRSLLDDVGWNQIRQVRLDGLTLAATRDLIRTRCRLEITRTTLRRWHSLSRGNPLFVLELAALHAAGSTNEAPLGPTTLGELIDARLARCTKQQRELLLVCALSGETPAAIIHSALPEPAQAEDAMDSLLHSGLLVEGPRGVGFAHPLLRAAAGVAPPAHRRRIHRTLATLIDQPEARARHLALAGVGAAAAAAAAEAAAMASARGAHDEAGDLATLAIQQTPSDDQTDRYVRTLKAARYRFAASDAAMAAALIEGILDHVSGPLRSEALRDLARYRAFGGLPLAEWAAILTSALTDVGDDDALRAAIQADLGLVLANSGSPRALIDLGEQARRSAARAGDTQLEGRVCAGMAMAAFQAGQGVRQDLIAIALRTADPAVDVSSELRPRYAVAHVLRLSGDLDRSRELFDHELRFARDYGLEANIPIVTWGLSLCETRAGNLPRAAALAQEGLELADAHSNPAGTFFNLIARSLCRAYSGLTDDADDDVARATELGAHLGIGAWARWALEAHGASRLAVGDARSVADLLAPAVAETLASGIQEPAMVPFVGDAVEALVLLGEFSEAERLLDPYEMQAKRMGRLPAIGTAARCRGLLLYASGDLAAATTVLDHAVGDDRLAVFPFEHARTLLVAGQVHRRRRHKSLAVACLTQAGAVFDRLGSPLWLARVAQELERTGLSRPPKTATTALTVAERAVADLAAEGLSTAEISARLYMAPRTVESHLHHIYGKLGVRSRTMMARVLQSGDFRH